MKGIHPWLVRWACHAGTRDFCSAFVAIVGPVQNIFFLFPYTITIPLSPIAQLGRQPRWVAFLLARVFGISLPQVSSADVKHDNVGDCVS